MDHFDEILNTEKIDKQTNTRIDRFLVFQDNQLYYMANSWHAKLVMTSAPH